MYKLLRKLIGSSHITTKDKAFKALFGASDEYLLRRSAEEIGLLLDDMKGTELGGGKLLDDKLLLVVRLLTIVRAKHAETQVKDKGTTGEENPGRHQEKATE